MKVPRGYSKKLHMPKTFDDLLKEFETNGTEFDEFESGKTNNQQHI